MEPTKLKAKRGLVVAVALAGFFAGPTLWIGPSVDDWGTIRPHVEGLPEGALRPGVFFRPIEQLLRWAAGTFPELNSAWMHSWTVLGHLVSVGVLYALLRPRGARIALVTSGLFATSASVAAAVWSLDAAIQTWSTACGLSSLWLYLNHPRRSWWLAAAVGAVLWKESGIVWLLLTPLIATYQAERTNQQRPATGLARQLATGLVVILVYVSVRAVAGTEDGLKMGADRYAIHLNPLSWTKHALQLGVVALSAPDTLAIFGDPGAEVWGWATLALSLPLACLALLGNFKAFGQGALLWTALLLAVAMGPHLLLGHVSEMYAHPIAATACLALAWPAALKPTRLLLASLLIFSAVSLLTSVHKAREMIMAGRSAQRVGDELARAWGNRPAPTSVCLTYPASPAGGYSVFQASPAKASGFGMVLYSKLGYRLPRSFTFGSDRDECERSDAEAMIWFETPSKPRIKPLNSTLPTNQGR